MMLITTVIKFEFAAKFTELIHPAASPKFKTYPDLISDTIRNSKNDCYTQSPKSTW